MNRKLHSKFVSGLQAKYGLCENDLKDYIENAERKETLSVADVCICGHKIINARYLMHKDGINSSIDNLMIGNCCIKQFIDKDNVGKHCDRCKQKHKNRLDNICNSCRLLCVDCDNKKMKNNNLCRSCVNNRWQKQQTTKSENKPVISVYSTMTITEYDLDF